MLLIGFGVGFELPIVVFYLVIFNIVPYAKLRAQWRVVYVVLMFVARRPLQMSPWTMVPVRRTRCSLRAEHAVRAHRPRKRIAEQKKAELALYGDDEEE